MPLLIAVAALSVALSAADEAKVTITKITETRVREVARSKDGGSYFTGEPASLKIALELALPEGAKLVRIEEPSTMNAIDDTGKDLTKIEKSFRGETEFWCQLFSHEVERGKLTLQLAPTERKATAFDLSFSAVATIATGQTTVELQQVKEFVPLDEAIFGKGAEYRVSRMDGKVNIDIRPESVHDRVQAISFKSKTKMVKNDGEVWGMGAATYTYSQGIEEDAKIIIFARTEFQKLNVTVDEKALKLP